MAILFFFFSWTGKGWWAFQEHAGHVYLADEACFQGSAAGSSWRSLDCRSCCIPAVQNVSPSPGTELPFRWKTLEGSLTSIFAGMTLNSLYYVFNSDALTFCEAILFAHSKPDQQWGDGILQGFALGKNPKKFFKWWHLFLIGKLSLCTWQPSVTGRSTNFPLFLFRCSLKMEKSRTAFRSISYRQTLARLW